MSSEIDLEVRLIPVKQIHVLNPRERARKKFAQIIANIAKLGLKKPITVAQSGGKNGSATYNLVCGQGRLEAYVELGEELIPAIVIAGTREDLLLMSLTENVARRNHSALELVKEISELKERGYTQSEIATKTDLAVDYVRGILQLIARGEEKLLQAVEKGQIPVNIAVTIATADDKEIQRALTEAYEKNYLRGKKLHSGRRPPSTSPVSSAELVKAYQKERLRQKLVVQRARVCETRLLFATNALKQLFRDENFVTLLRAEELDLLPQYLAAHFKG